MFDAQTYRRLALVQAALATDDAPIHEMIIEDGGHGYPWSLLIRYDQSPHVIQVGRPVDVQDLDQFFVQVNMEDGTTRTVRDSAFGTVHWTTPEAVVEEIDGLRTAIWTGDLDLLIG